MLNYEVRLSELARKDLDNIFDQIEEIASYQSAFKIVAKVYHKILSLDYAPERARWPYISGNVRHVRSGKYSIIYEVNKSELRVEILRVVYSRMNLAKLKLR